MKSIDWPCVAAVTTLVGSVAGIALVGAVVFVEPGRTPVEPATVRPLFGAPPSEVVPAPAPEWPASLARQTVAAALQNSGLAALFDPEPTGTRALALLAPTLESFPSPMPLQRALPAEMSARAERAQPSAPEPATKPTRPRDAPVLSALPPSHSVQPQRPPKPDPRYAGVLTAAEIARIRSSLRLTQEQEPHWRSFEPLLREVGRQQVAHIQSGRPGEFVLDTDLQQRLYAAATPLLMMLQPEQKAEARRLARSMGLHTVASMI